MILHQHQSMTIQCKMEDVFNGKFGTEDWSRIVNAIKSYVITQEEDIRTKNVGERASQELREYCTIARDSEKDNI